MHYFSRSTGSFYDSRISGERLLEVPDPDWQPPKIRVPDQGWTRPLIQIADPAWTMPVHRMADPDWRPQRDADGRLLPGQFPPLLTFEDPQAVAPLVSVPDPTARHPLLEVDDPAALAPRVHVPNPDCTIPGDAIEVSEELWRSVMHAHLHEGKIIGVDSRGLPVAVERPKD